MDWLFCSCTSAPKEKETIQAYGCIQRYGQLSKAKKQSLIGHATQAQTLQKIKKQTQRLKPKAQFNAQNNNELYFSIPQFKQQSKQSSMVFFKTKKSNYDDVIKKCQSENKPWQDPDFKYDLDDDIKGWKRIGEVKGVSNPTFMKYPITPNDIVQVMRNEQPPPQANQQQHQQYPRTRYYNGSWYSIMAVLAARYYRIQNLFACPLQINKWGVYRCKLLYNGIYQQVIVDDFFPVDANGELYSIRLYKQTDIWMIVLHKCWAKLLGGYKNTQFWMDNTKQYDALLKNGYKMDLFRTLSSSPILGQFNTKNFVDSGLSDKLFDILKDNYEQNYLITCENLYYFSSSFNIDTFCSYSVLGVFETKDNENQKVRLVQLRNPLKNDKMPEQRYNRKDEFWKYIDPHQKDRLEYWRIQKQGQDGIFYLERDSFMKNFNKIAISQINDNAHYYYQSVKVQHDKPIYISVNLQTKDRFTFSITQQAFDMKTVKGIPEYDNIRVLIAQVRYNFKNQQDYIYYCSKSYPNNYLTNCFQIDFGPNVKPGKYIIRILAAMKMKRVQSQMVLGFYSAGDFTVKGISDIKDSEFLSKTLLNRAKSIGFTLPNEKKNVIKEQLTNAKGWRCIENIFQSNICYIAYHIESTSQKASYSIEVNLQDFKNEKTKLQLQGVWKNKNEAQLPIKRGQQAIIPYTYSRWLKGQDLNPMLTEDRKLPQPTLIPI